MAPAAPLGTLLVTSGLLTQQALDEVLAFQKTDGRRLGELLAEKGLVRPHQLAQFLSHQLACPWVSLQRVEIAQEAIDKLPPDVARRHHMVPVHLRTRRGVSALYVAMDDPTDDVALSEATTAATMPVKPMVALHSEIKEHLERFYPTPVPPKVAPMPLIPAGSFPPVPPKTNPKMSKPPPPLPLSRPPTNQSFVPAPPISFKREESSVLDTAELIEELPESATSLGPTVLVVDAKGGLLPKVRAAVDNLDAQLTGVSLAEANKLALVTYPCAIVVGEELYANDRTGIDRLALDAGALLIVSNEAFEGAQLEGLLRGAIERWRSTTYEKGAVLEGRYELLRDLAVRGKPRRIATWEVRHLKTARRSVIRIGTRGENAGIIREQAALARVHHPGALELRDAGNTDLGDPYIVVESVEGRTLEGLVAARGTLEAKEAFALVRQTAEILASAHENGVRHGEVKLQHIVVVRDAWGAERVKLVGWDGSVTTDGPADPSVDMLGLRACAERVNPEVARVIVAATSMTQVAQLTKQPDATHVLDANPVMRGASLRPPAAAAPVDVKDLRKHPRAPYRTPVRVSGLTVEATDGRCEDVSAGGMLVVVHNHAIKKGAQVSLKFALPIDGRMVTEMGVVRWIHQGEASGIGIELISPGAETVKQFVRYVQHQAPA